MAILKRKKFWFNVHLVLTLICCVPILIVALSGAIISYHDEIIDALNQSKSFVRPSEKDALEPAEILNIFRKAKPVLRSVIIGFLKIKTKRLGFPVQILAVSLNHIL